LPAARGIDSVILPGDLGERVRELLEEWRQAEKLLRYGLTPRNRVLLHGPSGNGKTTLAGAVAAELGLPLVVVRISDVIGSKMGDFIHGVAGVFANARRTHCLLFIDECDSICAARSDDGQACAQERNGAVNTLLLELDRLPASHAVFFATNFADVLDPAMRRRVNLTLEMPAPTISDLVRLVDRLRLDHPLWPLAGFDPESCGATSFAQCEQMALDHARRAVLEPDFDPLGLQGKPRSTWLREQAGLRGIVKHHTV
jgi:SpoVK/Ycf46/Vps4 family AAA+-type ATPase